MEFLFKKKRFKKKYSNKDLLNFSNLHFKIFKVPILEKHYFNFFNTYAKKNYVLENKNCICKNEKDLLLAESDRYMVEFQTVICKNCGLIRAKKYFSEKDVKDFYSYHYRLLDKNSEDEKNLDPEYLYKKQYIKKKDRYDLINKYSNKKIEKMKVVDLGGGAGGILEHFKGHDNQLYLVDYYEPYLNNAKSKGIETIKGGLGDINFKPDLIILSHVIEHWSNFEGEIKNLISLQKKNETLNYIEFPGVDSLKLGRRHGDIIGDIHVPHVYYFHSKVFENIMSRYGFKKLYIDSQIKSIFYFTGEKGEIKNFFIDVKKDLEIAEQVRLWCIVKNFIKLFVPDTLLLFFRKLKKYFN